MRGTDRQQQKMFSYISPESRVPKDHPLRPVKRMVQTALEDLSAALSKMYSSTGRPSIAPEKLLKALLLQVFYSIRSERQLMERIALQQSLDRIEHVRHVLRHSARQIMPELGRVVIAIIE